MNTCRITACIVTYGGADDTIRCLESLLCQNSALHKIIVIDNQSPDNSADTVRSWINERRAGSQAPDLVMVDNSFNAGYAGGNNLAIKMAFADRDCSHVFILNNDTVLESNCISQLIRHIQRFPNVDIWGVKVFDGNGEREIQAHAGFRYRNWSSQISPAAQDGWRPSSVVRNMHYIYGCAMLVSRKFVAKAGLMTERFFLYFEEVDWCQRVPCRLGYACTAHVTHYHGKSIGSNSANERSELSEYYWQRNRLLHCQRTSVAFLPGIALVALASLFKRALQGNRRLLGAASAGIIDAILRTRGGRR